MGKNFTKKLLPLALTAAMIMPSVPAMAAPSDIAGHWAESVITQWQSKGLIQGYEDGTFKPGNTITRAEFVTLMNNAKGFWSEGSINFSDVKNGSWFYSAVARAVAAGYVKGYSDGSFKPGNTITRAEAAVMIANAARLSANEAGAYRFTDVGSIPAWARGSVGAVVAAGYMTGYPDGSFDANASISRAEAVSSLNRMLGGTAYQPTQPTTPTTSDDVVIEDKGTTLKNQTVDGNVTIAKSVGNGDVTLRNVTIKGDLIVKGGGSNTVTLEDVDVRGKVRLLKEGVHLHLDGDTDIRKLLIDLAARITQSSSYKDEIDEIILAGDGNLNKTTRIDVPAKQLRIENQADLILGGDVEKLIVDEDAKGAEIEIKKGTTVNELNTDAKIKLTGEGRIDLLDVSASGVTYDKNLDIRKKDTSNGATAPKENGSTSTGSNSGSGGSSGGNTGGNTTPTKVEITGAPSTNTELSVAVKTTEEEAKALLPTSVTLEAADKSNPKATITWQLKAGTTWSDTDGAENTFIGTITIPSNYTYSKGTLTVEGKVSVVNSPTTTILVTGYEALTEVRVNYAGTVDLLNAAVAKAEKPTTVTLKCADGTYKDVPLGDSWTLVGTYTATPYQGNDKVKFEQTINLPMSYGYNGKDKMTIELQVIVDAIPTDTINAFKAALGAAGIQKGLLTPAGSVNDAIDTDKIYVLTTPTNPEDVADGVQFIVDTSNAYSALVTAYTKAEQYVDGGSLVFTDADQCIALTNELTAATAPVQTLYDGRQAGSSTTSNAYLLQQAKNVLSVDRNSDAPYSSYKQPLKFDYVYKFVGDYNLDNASLHFEWKAQWKNQNETSNIAEYITIGDVSGTGGQYNPGAKVIKAPDEPKEVQFVVTVTDFYGKEVGKLGENGEYSATIGAPISVSANQPSTVPQFTVISDGTSSSTGATKFTGVVPITLNGAEAITDVSDGCVTMDAQSTLSDSSKVSFSHISVDKVEKSDTGLNVTVTVTTGAIGGVWDENSPYPFKEGILPNISIDTSKLQLKENTLGWYLPTDKTLQLGDMAVDVLTPAFTGVELANDPTGPAFTIHTQNMPENATVEVALAKVGVTIITDIENSTIKKDAIRGNDGDYSVTFDKNQFDSNATYHLWFRYGAPGSDWAYENVTSRPTYTFNNTTGGNTGSESEGGGDASGSTSGGGNEGGGSTTEGN